MATNPSIYSMLVPDPNDVLGALAFATYKQHASEVMEGILQATAGPPTQNDIDVFYRAASAPAMLAMYKQQAQALMTAFLDETLDSRWRALESEFQTTQIGRQLQAIQNKQSEKRSWKGWAADVSGNLVVSLVTILVIAGLLFGYQSLDRIWSTVGQKAGVLGSNTSDTGMKEQAAGTPAAAASSK